LKKNKNICWFCIICLIPVFAGCNNTTQNNNNIPPRIRAALKSNSPGTVKATVFVEGPDGNSLSGAVVVVKDSRNSLLQLIYESSSGSYTGMLEELPGETVYTVEAASILSSNIISLGVPYSCLTAAPNVTVFQDSEGNSVLSGQSLSSGLPVQIGWSDCGEGAVYQITIRTALKTVYAVSSNACTITVPARTIPAGAYLLEVSAQKIHGDLYYRSAPYYSASFINAPLVSCNVK
jgi:hypothetical protein